MDEIREADVLHREAFQDFVIFEARPWHQQHLGRLYAFWHKWNQDYFGGALVTPYVLFAEPSSPQRLGDYARVSGFGGHGQVRLRPSLLTGSRPSARGGDKYAEGRFRFVADVFLHETNHQWQHEVLGDLEDGYHGHGPKFRDQCNRIGAMLGLPPVRTSKARGKDKALPSCPTGRTASGQRTTTRVLTLASGGRKRRTVGMLRCPWNWRGRRQTGRSGRRLRPRTGMRLSLRRRRPGPCSTTDE